MEVLFDIETYINSLPECTKEIIIDCKKLQYIPSLTRFEQLEMLSCYGNQLTTLPPLPRSLKKILCGYNQLRTLPLLPENLIKLFCNHNHLVTLPHLPERLTYLCCVDNYLVTLPCLPESLTHLFCNNNYLVTLPHLPKNLELLCCNDNQLTTLPHLPTKLERLFCNNNKLSTLPYLPKNLDSLFCSDNQLKWLPLLNIKASKLWSGWCENNPIHDIVYNKTNNIEIVKVRIQILYNFRHLYYSLKFKKQFKYLLWCKIREPKIMVNYHPNNLLINLNEDTDLDEFLQNC